MYIKLLGNNVYYQEAGSGKRNLILLHGWMQDVSTFWQIVPLLKDDFKIYLIDFPGFGRSDVTPRPFKTKDYSDIIAEFIKQKKLEKAIVLGHSLGGRVAIKLAATQPAIFDKLILEDAAGIRPKRSIAQLVIYPLAKIFKYFMPNLFNLKEKTRYRFYKRLESDYKSAGHLRETLLNILKEDLTPDIRKINKETLLLWGEKDPTTEASIGNGRRMYRMIKKSKLEIFENVGHFPHLEVPADFAYYVKDFS